MANQVVVTWQDGLHFEGTANGVTVHMDALPPYGQGLGMGPMTLVLAALGGCTAMDIVTILQKERQELTGLSVDVTGEKAGDYPYVYTDIEVVYRVRGHCIRPDCLERAIALSEEKYCPVGIMLGKTARITSRYEIDEG